MCPANELQGARSTWQTCRCRGLHARQPQHAPEAVLPKWRTAPLILFCTTRKCSSFDPAVLAPASGATQQAHSSRPTTSERSRSRDSESEWKRSGETRREHEKSSRHEHTYAALFPSMLISRRVQSTATFRQSSRHAGLFSFVGEPEQLFVVVAPCTGRSSAAS